MAAPSHFHVYLKEEKWDPEPWSDLESDSGSNNEERSGKDAYAPKILRRRCFGESGSLIKTISVESSGSTASSKKTSRPPKRERDKFRKFVADVVEKMLFEGADFNLDNVELPISYKREKIQKVLDRYKQGLQAAHSH